MCECVWNELQYRHTYLCHSAAVCDGLEHKRALSSAQRLDDQDFGIVDDSAIRNAFYRRQSVDSGCSHRGIVPVSVPVHEACSGENTQCCGAQPICDIHQLFILCIAFDTFIG